MSPKKLVHSLSPQPGKVICIISGKSGVVTGSNDRTVVSPRYRKTMPDGAILSSRHAEEHALDLAKKRKIGKIQTVVVLRYGKSGLLRMAKPCPTCWHKLHDATEYGTGLHYSDSDGVIMEELIGKE